MAKLVGVGDNTVDRYLHLGRMFPRGNAVNVAVLAHRYGAGTSYIGWLGRDPHGDLILRALRDEGVDTLGAGDAFAARLLCEHFEGEALRESMARAVEATAATCGYHGAWGRGAPLWNLKSKEQ